MHTIDSPFQTHILDKGVEWSPLESIWTVRGTEKYCAQATTEVVSTTLLGEGDSPLLDLEDHAAIETSCEGQGMFNPLVDIGNIKMVSKPWVLCELKRANFSKIPGSTDHLSHCAGLAHYTKTTLPHSSPTVFDSTSKEFLTVGDPVTTLIQCEGQFFLAIVQINDIVFNSSTILEINPRFLVEPTVTVEFQIYQLIEVSGDDPDINSADWKWNCKMEKSKKKGVIYPSHQSCHHHS